MKIAAILLIWILPATSMALSLVNPCTKDWPKDTPAGKIQMKYRISEKCEPEDVRFLISEPDGAFNDFAMCHIKRVIPYWDPSETMETISDITYIKVERGHVYLAVIMDLFSRKIIGWSLDMTMTNQLIVDAFEMALASRNAEPGLILHSDRGVQYRSGEYQALLLSEGIRPSMSRKGNCWDNAAMESFFARFKVEALYAEDVTSKREAYSCVFDYIECFYNSHRRHSALGYKSPNAYEQEYLQMCA